MTDREVVTIKEYIDTRVAALEQATRLAADILERRLNGMNEFRDALKNQSATFITRPELDVLREKIDGQITSLQKSRDEASGKASQSSTNIAIGLAIVSLVIALLGFILRL